ncbi:hypothetical protein L3476_17545 [Paenibacillus thiaminolyticus]|uniref:hypothetical protein n=1 Tax=Paenibacillus thiaminolyticus TaxID=49283 RepID=UPI001164D45C|nr:hypothetical protein [Paenibacillus thiaminolyticus]NGP61293.1 hypothetical protein [Paenibacillus thiaminolyticus]WCR25162.1 hypothetical protein L3476_17545 [Paenibacillus thiaminolyticus]
MKGRKKAEACGNTVTNQVIKKMRGDGMAVLSGKPRVVILGAFHMKAKADLFITESGCLKIDPVHSYLA